MKNYFTQMLLRLNLVAHKQAPCRDADGMNYMGRSVSQRLIKNGRWQMLEAVNDAEFDLGKPVE